MKRCPLVHLHREATTTFSRQQLQDNLNLPTHLKFPHPHACTCAHRPGWGGLLAGNRQLSALMFNALGLQVFLDVVETVNLLVNSNGTVVRSEVVGALKMRTFLSGMPECKLGLNDKASALLAAPTASSSQLFVASLQP